MVSKAVARAVASEHCSRTTAQRAGLDPRPLPCATGYADDVRSRRTAGVAVHCGGGPAVQTTRHVWGRLGFDAGNKTLGACRVGNRTRKSTVATFIVANDETYGDYALAA